MRHLYIDPGTGSMLISAFIALISVAFFMVKGFIYQKLNIGGTKGTKVDLAETQDLIFYSEGKQYWNVFKPLLEECNNRSLSATYLTSDEDDPGLGVEFEHIQSQYIGKGREAYYILNRLSAEMVVMTTPGLDVLEIKKSKNVKHYSHIGHATGSVAGYKAYGTDYYDSVLLGGDGDVDVIRELEAIRKLPKKEIKVIGHTYLDVYRNDFKKEAYKKKHFKNDKPVVLLSPTWGNHGLLTKYGEQILASLTQANLFNVIVRPHPQSFKSEEALMNKLMVSFPSGDSLYWDQDVDGLKSMSQANIMISDFSGIIFDYLSLFEKPILTMHGQYEKRGRDASDLAEDPWDLKLVGALGQIIKEGDIENLSEVIVEALRQHQNLSQELDSVKHIFDKFPNLSSVRGVDFIAEKLIVIKELDNAQVQSKEYRADKAPSGNLIYKIEKNSTLSSKITGTFKTLLHPNALFQAVMALFLVNGYIFLGNKLFLEEGLNQMFLEKLSSRTIYLTFTLFAAFMVSSWVKSKGEFFFKKNFERIEWKDLLLLAFPMTPILQYLLANQDILSFSSASKVFIFFFVASIIFVVLIPFILSSLVSKSLTTPISTAFLFIVLNMANFGKEVAPLKIGLILALLIIGMFAILFFNKKNILIFASLIFFITNFGLSFLDKDADGLDEQHNGEVSDSRILEFTAGKTPVNTPDVFLLIYESYSNQETMELYGFDNSEQVNYLINQNFAIYDGTYTVGPSSIQSMARVMDTDYLSLDPVDGREVIAAQSSALKLFNQEGYVTNASFSGDYMTKGFEPQYKNFYPDARYSIAPHKIIINAILEGEFRWDADFSTLGYQSYVDYKQSVLAQNLSEPEFMYSHNDLPGHSQNSGVLLPDENERHFDGIHRANAEMRADIEAIQLENRDAIIIIAGDHGPYLTKSGVGLHDYDIKEIDRMDIQDRYGSFLAIHWPDSSYEKKYDIQILQDVVPAIISYMYEDDSLFDQTRMIRESIQHGVVGGAAIVDGVIDGGIDDGLPLFENAGVRSKNIKNPQ